ncbi:hypothetical protein B0T26DRAFT_119464 [Lasiosphaeria miniovina]|uniref:Uncharacterized protein n=1 Tax=Lasiosphaeria miniovina TaxID=1954250 RepID=A0AA40B3U1_9PEZI|nr:uncharacterized protein B0T26DRAFT_119464 [Lasiosphaeria miniovina]KAK0727166.1 hypothetical protein B0T26DRAFT_119464 [Lasiosphaeria miniovina]
MGAKEGLHPMPSKPSPSQVGPACIARGPEVLAAPNQSVAYHDYPVKQNAPKSKTIDCEGGPDI